LEYFGEKGAQCGDYRFDQIMAFLQVTLFGIYILVSFVCLIVACRGLNRKGLNKEVRKIILRR
jgi:hypothetical protein